METKIVLSFSKIQTYQKCPWLYHLVFSEGWRSGPHKGQAMGNSLHDALGLYHSLDKSEKSLERLLEIFDQVWVNEGYSSLEEIFDAYKEGQTTLREFFKIDTELSKHYNLFEAEKEFQISINEHIDLRGAVDRIDVDADKKYQLIEYKSSGKWWPKERIDSDLQLTLYKIGLERGLNIAPLSLNYLFLKEGRWVKTERTDDQIKQALQLVKETAENIRSKKFEPKTESCIKCEFKKRCQYSTAVS